MIDDTKKIAAVFHDREKFDVAIRELEKSFPRRSINILNVDGYELEDQSLSLETIGAYDPDVHIHPEERNIGLGSIIAVATFIGTGIAAAIMTNSAVDLYETLSLSLVYGVVFGLICAGLVYLFYHKIDEKIRFKLKNGGLVVWVRTSNLRDRVKAKNIFYNYGAKQVKAIS
tara:strand:+ start:50 stop:565 length:516 start_codon:yes stop_codon:yes gene_type:complete